MHLVTANKLRDSLRSWRLFLEWCFFYGFVETFSRAKDELRTKKKTMEERAIPPSFSVQTSVQLSHGSNSYLVNHRRKNNKNYQLCRLDRRTNLLFELIKRQVVQVSFGCNSTEETVKAKSRKITLSNITWTERAQRTLSDISPQ